MIRSANILRSGGILAFATILTTGCAQEWVESRDGMSRNELERIRTINALELSAQAATPPAVDPKEVNPADPQVAALKRMLEDASPRTLDVGLDDFRSSLLSNNLQLEVARFSPEIAAAQVRSEYGKLDVTFGTTVMATQQVQDASSNNLPNLALSSEYTEAETTLSVPLAIGGTIDLTADLYRYETEYYEPTPLGSSKAFPSNLSVEVTLPILEGAGYDANLGPIAIAAYDERISEVELRSMLSSLLSSSEQVYWQLLRSWKSTEIQLQLLKLARQQVTDTEALAKAGVVPASQRFRAQLTVEQRQASLFEAELDLRRDMRSVKIIMNRPDLPLDGDRVIKPSTKPLLRSFVLNRVDLAMIAVKNRSELLQARLQLEQDDLKMRIARNALLPSLGFTGSVGLLGIGANGGREAINTMFDGTYPPGWSVGLDLSMPIGNREAEGEYQSAVISRLQTLSKQRELTMQIAQDVYDAVDQLELTWARLLAYRRAQSDAEKNLDASRLLFKSGGSTSMDVALAIEDLGDARLSVLDSEITYQIAMINLATATGTALGRQAVEIGTEDAGPASD
ncbi:MAG: hypothetical protein CMJ23_07105 [Phycisphaerae bacterium]|nr:hypothetical protein [Phycisphaerae bacterium]